MDANTANTIQWCVPFGAIALMVVAYNWRMRSTEKAEAKASKYESEDEK